MIGSISILAILPFIQLNIFKSYRKYYIYPLSFFFFNYLFLGYMATQLVVDPFLFLSLISTFNYFYFFFSIPVISFFEFLFFIS